MGARRTETGGFTAGVEITAVAALPHDGVCAVKNGFVFNVLQEFAVTLFVMTFGNADRVENFGDRRETFTSCDLCEAGIEPVVFIIFAIGGGGEIGGGVADDTGGKVGTDRDGATFKKFEKAFGVFFFLIGGFSEDRRDLHKTLPARLGGKIGVAVAGLRFSGKTLQQVLFVLKAELCSTL